MLKFTCNQQVCADVEKMLISKVEKAMKSCELKTLAADYFDSDLTDKLYNIVESDEKGFIFDSDDLLGEESYGYVYDFFEAFLNIVEQIKQKIPDITIDGYFYMNEHGPNDCVYRKSIHTTEKMKTVQFTRQLQCIRCNEWVNPKDVKTYLTEDEYDGYDLLPQGLRGKGSYCICHCKPAEPTAPPSNEQSLIGKKVLIADEYEGIVMDDDGTILTLKQFDKFLNGEIEQKYSIKQKYRKNVIKILD